MRRAWSGLVRRVVQSAPTGLKDAVKGGVPDSRGAALVASVEQGSFLSRRPLLVPSAGRYAGTSLVLRPSRLLVVCLGADPMTLTTALRAVALAQVVSMSFLPLFLTDVDAAGVDDLGYTVEVVPGAQVWSALGTGVPWGQMVQGRVGLLTSSYGVHHVVVVEGGTGMAVLTALLRTGFAPPVGAPSAAVASR